MGWNVKSSGALESITMSKASGGDGIPVELFQILKDDALKAKIRVFSNESTLRMRWPQYGSFSFSIIPSKEHPGLISFRMDYLDLLAVQGTLKSLLQHHSSKAPSGRGAWPFWAFQNLPCPEASSQA